MDLYAVIGNPIAHSKSPIIHAEFAKQTQQDLRYVAIESPLDSFIATLQNFFHQGGKGCNVTLPFKQQAWEFAAHKTPRAEIAGAANTLKFINDQQILADNTDGIGLLRDLTINCNYNLRDKTILVLGAGGATRGILQPLLAEKPRYLVVANRTINKAIALADIFSQYGNIKAMGLNDLENKAFDVIINATSASIKSEPINLPNKLAKNAFCYDLAYGDKPTLFMQWANNNGANAVSDGLGMLVEQAAEAFYIWREVFPQTQPVIKKLRSHPFSRIRERR